MSKIPVPQQWNAKLDQPITPAAQQFLNAVADNSGGGGSGVTDVTGTSPVASSGGTTPDISLPTQFPTWYGLSPPSDPVKYPYWNRTDTGVTYKWYTDTDSSQWVQEPAQVGEQGPTGATGATGSTGVPGATGPSFSATGTGFVYATSGTLDAAAKTNALAANAVSSIAATGLVVPIAANFTSFGAGIVLTDKVGRLQVLVPDNTVLRGAMLSSIATPYTIDIGVTMMGLVADTDATFAGLLLSDGTKYVGYYAGNSGVGGTPVKTANTRFARDNWTNSTTFGTTVRSTPLLLNANLYFLRITDDGTTRKFWASNNGKDFVQVYSETTNTFLTPTKFGMGFYGNSPNGENMVASVAHWLVSSSVLGDAA